MGGRRKNKTLMIFFEFLILLNIFLIPFYLSIKFDIQIHQLKVLEAHIVYYLLNLAKVESSVRDNFIYIGDVIFEVSWDSTGWKSLYLFLSLVISTPLFFRKKLKFLALGLPLIFFLNILRIFATIYFFIVLGVQYEFLHQFLWRYFMSISVLIMWFLFLYKHRYNIGEANIIIGCLYGRRRKHKD